MSKPSTVAAPFEAAKAGPKAFEFGYQTEDQIRDDVQWRPLTKLPGCEIGVTSGNTNRAVAIRDELQRKVQSKKKYEKGEAMTGAQRLKVNNELVALECLHGLRVIENHDMPIDHPKLGLFENTVACRHLWMRKLPDFRSDVNANVEAVTEAAGEAEEESSKN